jgi:hypothetical protein
MCLFHYIRRNLHFILNLNQIWGFHGSDYEEYRLLGYKNPVCNLQEKKYVSAKDPSRLILCNIWGLYGGDYAECCYLGYKNSVHTSQEVHYFSATESSRLMLFNIWGFHGGDYEECRLLVCDAMWLLIVLLRYVLRFVVTANVPGSLILSAVMEATSSSKISGITIATRLHNPDRAFFINLNLVQAQMLLLTLKVCGLVVRLPGYRHRGPGLDSRRCQIWEAVGLERGPLGPCDDKGGATWKK